MCDTRVTRDTRGTRAPVVTTAPTILRLQTSPVAPGAPATQMAPTATVIHVTPGAPCHQRHPWTRVAHSSHRTHGTHDNHSTRDACSTTVLITSVAKSLQERTASRMCLMREAPPLLGSLRTCPQSLPLASPRKRRGRLGESGHVYINIFAVGCLARGLLK